MLFIFDCSQLVSAFCNYQEKGITEKTVLKCFFNIILKWFIKWFIKIGLFSVTAFKVYCSNKSHMTFTCETLGSDVDWGITNVCVYIYIYI